MKLELKHLTPYLPYGLKIEHPTMLIGKRKISELKNLGQTNIEISHRLYVQISECKPILNPMTSLSKEQIEILSIDLKIKIKYSKSKDFLSRMSYWDSIFLLENHFDIFGLIDKGLAISIHDVSPTCAVRCL